MYRLKAFVVVIAFVILPLMLQRPGSARAAGGFTNFELGAQSVGQTCPSSNATAEAQCTNGAAEPQIRSDPSGTFYGTSENGLGGGTDAWKSTDAGQHYTFLGDPDLGTASGANTHGFAPGGGDTDLATAPQRNANGRYNVYVASLSLASVDVSTSMDGGATWTLNPVGALIPVDDREWIAADMASKVCVSYHDIATFHIVVNCSYNAGLAFTQVASAFDASHQFLAQNNVIGNLQIDPRSHIIYQTFAGIGPEDFNNTTGFVQCTVVGCPNHVVYMAVSTDGGQTFTDYIVYDSPTQNFGHQFINVSVDRAGNVYCVYTDNHNTYYSFSTNHGKTWTGPFQISRSPANTAIFPWSTAGTKGRLGVVYYGTSYYDGVNPPDNYPASADWYVYYAENDNALTPGSGFSQVQVTDFKIHSGGVCESGVTCTGNRDLYDDFGVAASPTTNALSIIYSDDQYDQYTNNPPPSGCTAANNNTANCDHTNVATGMSRLFSNAPGGGGPGGGNGGECQRDSQSSKAEQDLLTSLNAHRVAAGLPTLTLNTTQSDQARDHSCDNEEQGQNEDQDSEGNTHDQRMRAAGLTFATSGENNSSAVQTATTTTGSLLDSSLMSDPTAKLNILNPAMTTVGIGAVDVNGVIWVTEDFSG